MSSSAYKYVLTKPWQTNQRDCMQRPQQPHAELCRLTCHASKAYYFNHVKLDNKKNVTGMGTESWKKGPPYDHMKWARMQHVIRNLMAVTYLLIELWPLLWLSFAGAAAQGPLDWPPHHFSISPILQWTEGGHWECRSGMDQLVLRIIAPEWL